MGGDGLEKVCQARIASRRWQGWAGDLREGDCLRQGLAVPEALAVTSSHRLYVCVGRRVLALPSSQILRETHIMSVGTITQIYHN